MKIDWKEVMDKWDKHIEIRTVEGARRDETILQSLIKAHWKTSQSFKPSIYTFKSADSTNMYIEMIEFTEM